MYLVGLKKSKKVCVAAAEFGGGVVGSDVIGVLGPLSRSCLLLGQSVPGRTEIRGMAWLGFCYKILTLVVEFEFKL